MNFDHIEYLKDGNQKQVYAYHVLTHYGIMTKLSAFDPILVGTIPINIDTDSSDIDIICYVTDNEHFSSTLRAYFQEKEGFKLRQYQEKSSTIILANFRVENFEIEVFG